MEYFSASLRDDLVAGDVYMHLVKEGSEEAPLDYTLVKWFVGFFIYDDARVMQDADCLMLEIEDPVAGFTYNINDINVGEHNLKWNIYGVLPYLDPNRHYMKDDYVYYE